MTRMGTDGGKNPGSVGEGDPLRIATRFATRLPRIPKLLGTFEHEDSYRFSLIRGFLESVVNSSSFASICVHLRFSSSSFVSFCSNFFPFVALHSFVANSFLWLRLRCARSSAVNSFSLPHTSSAGMLGRYLAAILLTFPTPAYATEILHVHSKYIEEKDFQRISEYFSGLENTGRRIITRSRSDARSGMYFVITLDRKSPQLAPGSTIEVQLIAPHEPDIRTFRLPFPENAPRSREIFAGITGHDWPDKDTPVLAWKITLYDAQEIALAQKESYLWKTR